jgi:hypothetical protein
MRRPPRVKYIVLVASTIHQTADQREAPVGLRPFILESFLLGHPDRAFAVPAEPLCSRGEVRGGSFTGLGVPSIEG